MDYESLNEELISIYQKNSKNSDGFADQILSRAARLGVLQAAMLEDSNATIDPSIVALLSQTIEEVTIAATANSQALENYLPVRQAPQEGFGSREISSLDAEGFFEEYPECMKVLPETDSTSDSDSDDSSVVEVVSSRRPRKNLKLGNPQQELKLSSTQTKNNSVQNASISAPPPQQSRPISNPYQKRAQPNINNRGLDSRSNPYAKNAAQSNAFVYTQETQDQSDTAVRKTASNSQLRQHHQQQHHAYGNPIANSSWDNHQQQQNPFQTAKEIAHGNDNQNNYHQHAPPTSNDGWNRYSDPNDRYGNPHNAYPPLQEEVETAEHGGPSIPDSLKRKFQPPKRVENSQRGGKSSVGSCPVPKRSGGGVQIARPTSSSSRADNGANVDDQEELPEELQHLDKELVKKIQNEIMESGDKITFDDIAGLDEAKQTVQEVVCWPMKRPDLFTGLRRAPNGLLLYGPPGTGKTLIGKAIAHESGATFFSISSSSLTSKWIGEGEKLVRTLFAVAAFRQPAVVFIDEIDSLLTQRKASENEASRRIKTEFLVQLDGTGTTGQGRVLVIGATNRPQELDEAARRRFTKRLYIPLPAEMDRSILLQVMLKTNNHILSIEEVQKLARETDGFSGADLKALCTDAAMGPIRQLGDRALTIDVKDVPAISYKHFRKSLKGTKPSVAPSDLIQYEEWDKVYGTNRASEEDSSSDEE
ncbi:unnamed protein product [Cylindrotheca closterium]|uniref:AAA+ ATPase domain-containing protein n=1 Tax=Cylindrotheca closterium TaxID=2856 RepID=A0AAD2JPG7_9STRA|nr:unnamed protein product [Cylindrotheca closterium]